MTNRDVRIYKKVYAYIWIFEPVFDGVELAGSKRRANDSLSA